mmetsp:Transcript_17902/g.17971  ORF Transcript_17902/g.17971 Transcript_17902/m.17971 type:complete len:182 (-) Transcript_17902:248-793(-)
MMSFIAIGALFFLVTSTNADTASSADILRNKYYLEFTATIRLQNIDVYTFLTTHGSDGVKNQFALAIGVDPSAIDLSGFSVSSRRLEEVKSEAKLLRELSLTQSSASLMSINLILLISINLQAYGYDKNSANDAYSTYTGAITSAVTGGALEASLLATYPSLSGMSLARAVTYSSPETVKK